MVQSVPRFSSKTLSFLTQADRQKSPLWLENNRPEYEQVLLTPLKNLAQTLIREIGPLAPDYHFPIKGIGRLKRAAHRAHERGGRLYKNWMAYSASKPNPSRFENNPSLFFLINPEDQADPVLIAGGLYMPSSRQVRALRNAIAEDVLTGKHLDALFKSRPFAQRFTGGFSTEKKSTRPTRGFAPEHPRMEWLKLQAFFVWRSYTRKEFASANFAKLVAADLKQALKLNRILESAIDGGTYKASIPPKATAPAGKESSLLEQLAGLKPAARKMDF